MSTSVHTETQQYSIDKTHSNVEFVVRHLMITKVRGRFSDVTGTIDADASGLPVAIDVEVDAASIDTRDEQRDTHLRSADFFDVANHAKMTYKSTRVEGSAGSFKIYGDLTLHGVTREVVLDGSFEGRGTDPWGGQRVGYSAEGRLNRKDFGLNWNQALETGGVLVGDDIRIELSIQAVKK